MSPFQIQSLKRPRSSIEKSSSQKYDKLLLKWARQFSWINSERLNWFAHILYNCQADIKGQNSGMTRGQGCMSFFLADFCDKKCCDFICSMNAWWQSHHPASWWSPGAISGTWAGRPSANLGCSRHNTWKHGACGKPSWNKNFQLHPILRHFWISLKPCYHVDIEKPMVILKTSGRCNRIHKSRIHFFPSPNIAEAGGLSSSGEIC